MKLLLSPWRAQLRRLKWHADEAVAEAAEASEEVACG